MKYCKKITKYIELYLFDGWYRFVIYDFDNINGYVEIVGFEKEKLITCEGCGEKTNKPHTKKICEYGSKIGGISDYEIDFTCDIEYCIETQSDLHGKQMDLGFEIEGLQICLGSGYEIKRSKCDWYRSDGKECEHEFLVIVKKDEEGDYIIYGAYCPRQKIIFFHDDDIIPLKNSIYDYLYCYCREDNYCVGDNHRYVCFQ